MPTKRFTITLPAKLAEELDHYATTYGFKRSTLITNAVDYYLPRLAGLSRRAAIQRLQTLKHKR